MTAVPTLVCTQSGCLAPAIRALVNSFGYVHLECLGHVGAPYSRPDSSRLFRASPEALPALCAAGRRPADFPAGSETVEVPLDAVLALSVMEG